MSAYSASAPVTGEHDRGQGEERRSEVADQEPDGVRRRERLEDAGYSTMPTTPRRRWREPRDHHGPEQTGRRRGASTLHEEQQHDDDRGERHHGARQRRLTP
jgi:hypothetical protein